MTPIATELRESTDIVWNEDDVRIVPDIDIAYVSYISEFNDWMDCIYIVDISEAKRTAQIIHEAMDWWWDADEVDPYGETIEQALMGAGIEYTAFYQPSCW